MFNDTMQGKAHYLASFSAVRLNAWKIRAAASIAMKRCVLAWRQGIQR